MKSRNTGIFEIESSQIIKCNVIFNNEINMGLAPDSVAWF